MSLQDRLGALITAIGADIKTINTKLAAVQPSTPWKTITMAGNGVTADLCNPPQYRLDTADILRFRGAYTGATYTGGTFANGIFTPPATPLFTLLSTYRPTSRRIINGIASTAMADIMTVVETNGQVWLTGDLDPSALLLFDGATVFLK